MQVILGSQSPRRREILSFFSLPFIQKASDFDEESVLFHGDPIEYAQTLSRGKASSLLSEFPHEILLTADTIIRIKEARYSTSQGTLKKPTFT